MRALLDSSWMRFAPAGREYEWPTGAPLTQLKEEDSGSELDLSLQRSPALPLYVLLPAASALVLAVLVGLWLRRCSGSKLGLSRVVSLDLEDPESRAEILSSLTRNAQRLNSTSSDGSDGVFVMVYLPPPYDQNLSRITRTSLSSTADLLPRTSLSSTTDLLPRTSLSSTTDLLPRTSLSSTTDLLPRTSLSSTADLLPRTGPSGGPEETGDVPGQLV